MKYVDEYRSPAAVRSLTASIARSCTRQWTLMEICGGQTHSIVRFGLDKLLPESVNLIHGPGCPVCVTPVSLIDHAIDLARRPGVVLCSFGDMLRVPGSSSDLLTAKARGGDVRIVTSPIDTLRVAQREPDKEVVLFAVGFETTAPATAMTAFQAKRLGVGNLSLLVSHMLVPPAMEAILSARDNQVQGFLAAGHVCTVMGYHEYEPIAARYGTPIIVTGFEPVDLLQGIWQCIEQLESGVALVENRYERYVRPEGNPTARQVIAEVYRTADRHWRGLGLIPQSGWELAKEYVELDAKRRFNLADSSAEDSGECIAGLVLKGALKPYECPAFGVRCTPLRPLGAPMVSSEGACAAYFQYRDGPTRPDAAAPEATR